jgi:hypothetical protein
MVYEMIEGFLMSLHASFTLSHKADSQGAISSEIPNVVETGRQTLSSHGDVDTTDHLT